jgi:hypothetical protein
MFPKTEKQPFFEDFFIKYKHIAWSDKRCDDYQYDAIKQIMIYLWGGSYKSITELGKENYKQKLQIQQRFGTEENFLHQLPLPDRLSGVVHMATGTGKSYVIFAIAYSFPCYGVY